MTETHAIVLAALVAVLPPRWHRRFASLAWKLSGSARINSAWTVFCVTLALNAVRQWWVESWQRGLLGLLATCRSSSLAFICRLPFLRSIVDKEVGKELASIEKKMHGNGDPHAIVKLPAEGMPCSEILQQLQNLHDAEASIYARCPSLVPVFQLLCSLDSCSWGGEIAD